MKKIYIVLFMIAALGVYGQKGIVNNGARIVVGNGAYIKVQNDNTAGYTNNSYGTKPGRIDLDGEIQLSGFFNNNASENNVFINQDGIGRVVFYGSSLQTVGGTYATYFEGIELAGTGGVSLGNDSYVWGALIFSQGKLHMNGNLLELAASSSVAGSPGTSSMIVPGTGGIVRKYYSIASSYTFAIGEIDGAPYYLPIDINFASGTFNPGAYVDLEMVAEKHPENVSISDYLTRYWAISQSNITNFNANLSFKYTDADVNGTETSLYAIRYDGNFWDIFDPTNTANNRLTASVAEFGEFTGGKANDVSPHLAWETDGVIEENAENGSQIKVNIENDAFVSTLNDAQWSLTGLPDGVAVSTIVRTYADTVVITLSGNRLDDYDSPLTLDLSIGNSEFVHTSSGVLNAENSLTISADNDTEELSMTYDGAITEGSEDGEKISVTLTGGTFAQSLNTGSWSAVNMPTGVSQGTITRISATEVQLALSGNASADYDTNITDFELTVPASDINDYSGVDFVLTEGVTFTAIDEDLLISMSDGGSGIEEGAENGHAITVTISERVFSDPLTQNNWTVQNLPGGVTFDYVDRISDTEAHVYLSGNRTKDYDTNIADMQITIAIGEIISYSAQAIVNTGVTFNAFGDSESITIAVDPDGITEGDMSSDYITATIAGGTFVQSPQTSNWILNNFPAGVSIGSLTYNSPTEVQINLTGATSIDFDSNVTTVGLDVLAADVDDTNTNISSDNMVTIFADNDAETIALSGGPFSEGAEDAGIITATLSGGNFVSTINLTDVSMNNLPDGVTLGNVIYQTPTQVKLVLAGNATVDYDTDITNVSATFSASVIEETSTDVSGVGVTFEAVVEPASLSLSDNGAIVEGSESGQELYVEVVQDTLVTSIDPSAYTLSGLPVGISANSISRTGDNTVTITLTGTRTKDYDTNITNAEVTIDASQFQYSGSALSASTGWTFVAINDTENISFSALAPIVEGSEEGAQIDVDISGGTFPVTLSASEWAFNNKPAGVSIGSVTRNSQTSLTLTLTGNATADYDTDIIADMLTITGSQIDDYSDVEFTAADNSITFEATIETQNLILSSTEALYEPNLDGAVIDLEISGATFVTPIDPVNFVLNNYPSGITKQSVDLVDGNHVQITLAFDGTDFDTDFTEFYVTLFAAGSSIGEEGSSNAYTIEAYVEPGTFAISHAGLNEENINGAVVDLTLIDEAFADNILDISNFNIQNAPNGTSITSVSWVTNTTATLELAFNGYDFDSNYTDFTVSMLGAETVAGYDYTSNTLSITATDDDESIIFTTSANIQEGAEDGTVISLSLSGGSFNETLDPSAFAISGLPSGVSVGGANYINSTEATITLLGNATADYDTDIVITEIAIVGSQIHDFDLANLVATGTITFEAAIESQNLVLSSLISLDENNLDGAILGAKLVGATFSSPIEQTNFELNNLPPGATIANVSLIDPDSVSIELYFDGTDFDVDYNNFNLILLAAGSSLGETVSSNVLPVAAIVEAGTLEIAHAGLSETNLDGAVISLSLVNDAFEDNAFDVANFGLSNAPEGCTIASVAYQTSTTAQLTLAFDGTDFDSDFSSFGITLEQIEVVSNNNYTSNALLIQAIDDDESVAFTALNTITEGAEDGAQIEAVLTGGTFAQTQMVSEWIFTGLPAGVTLGAVDRVDHTSAILTLSGNATSDYDFDIVVDQLAIGGSQVNDFTEATLSAVGEVTFTAIIETQELVLSTIDPLTESNLDGAVVGLKLSNGSFITPLGAADFNLNNQPTGVTIQSASVIQTDSVALTLAFDGTDFDIDVTNFSVTLLAQANSTGVQLISNVVTITAEAEPQSMLISHAGLTEENLDGAVIDLTLINDEFENATLSTSNFNIQNAPNGTSITSVSWVTNTTATLELAFNGYDFDSNYTDFTVSMLGTETVAGYDYTSNTLSITATDDDESIIFTTSANIQEGAEDGTVISLSLSGGSFNETLDPSAFAISGLPSGVSVGGANYINSTEATITLLGNATADYDTDIVITEIAIVGSQIHDFDLANLVATGTITFEAAIESQNLVLSSLISLDENNLDGAILGAKLVGATFSSPIEQTNFELNNLPPGATIANVSLIDPDSVSIELYFDGTDFDVDYNNFNLILLAAGSSLGETVSSNVLPVAAIVEAGTLEIAHAGLSETNLDGAVISLSLVNDAFEDNAFDVANFGLSNAPEGCTIASVAYQTSTTAQLTLAFDGTDFDSDFSSFGITLEQIEVVSNNNYTSNALLIQAIDDDESVAFTALNTITEGAEDGAQIEAVLTGGTFAQTQMVSEWAFTGLPVGVTLGAVDRVDHTSAILTLSGNATSDYDFDIIVNQLTIGGSQVNDFAEATLSAVGEITFTAIIETQELVLSTIDPLTESNLDGAVINLELVFDSFNDDVLDVENFNIENAPTGCGISTVNYTSASTGTITLNFDGTDFDTDYPEFVITMQGTEVTSGITHTSNSLVVAALDDSESIAFSANYTVQESDENGATFEVELTGGTFNSTLTSADWSMNWLPTGVIVSGVEYVDPYHATMQLSGIRSEDYDNQENAILQIAESQFNASDGVSLVSENAIAFVPYVESLQSLADSVYENAINEPNLQFEFTDEWITDISANANNFVLQNEPVGLSISNVIIQDSAHFAIELTYTGDGSSEGQTFNLLVNNSILNGVEDLLSSDIVFVSGVSVETLNSSVELYTSDNEIFLKQHNSAQKGKLEIYEANGRKIDILPVDARSINYYRPMLKNGVYILRFVTEQGRMYLHKCIIQN